MRKCSAIVLLVAFSWIGGLAQDARAGITLDVLLFKNGTGRVLTIPHSDPEPGYIFTGYYGGSVPTIYDSYNGLALADMYEWKGIDVSSNERGSPIKSYLPPVGLLDSGGVIGQFGCLTGPPFYAAALLGLGLVGLTFAARRRFD